MAYSILDDRAVECFDIQTMGQPKRKQSKQRSRKRRGANRFKAPLLVKEPDGSFSRPHRVNPETGEYRGRQVLDLEV
ncbi:MAG: 50S ribosomal protein L32 [Opitutales bacterium]|nr:50S ribosomal protein L32 [Opitutales bacterium]